MDYYIRLDSGEIDIYEEGTENGIHYKFTKQQVYNIIDLIHTLPTKKRRKDNGRWNNYIHLSYHGPTL